MNLYLHKFNHLNYFIKVRAFCFRFQEYYDRDDGYGAPKAPSYSAPSPSYEAPSPQYSAPSDSYGAPSHSGGGDGFNDFLNALAAFLPIGLFLAAIPPNLITIST